MALVPASPTRRARRSLGLALLLLLALPPAVAAQSTELLRRLSLEELMNLELTTVSRVPQAGLLTPAAVFVITAEDIRRSGATTVAAALQLAPGVHAVQLDSNKWAIGLRGFADRLSRSVLVLVDGRAVYSTLFAGTYWEVQDVPLADIDRIEVIRGPGGTLWGANAVNGIINIITKPASATQGWHLRAGTGGEQHALAAVRFGGSRNDTLHYRAYAKVSDRDAAFHADGRDFDAWRLARVGGRADWTVAPGRTLTLEGEVYGGAVGQRSQLTTYDPPALTSIDRDARLSGGHLLARWHSARRRLQVYYDRTNRREPTFREDRDTVDVDFQQLAFEGDRHQLLWGASARLSAGDITSVETQRFLPEDRTDTLVTGFVQDEIALRPGRLQLTLGAKLERNGYSGVELQPSARLLWTPRAEEAVFLAATRAVRTPSRVEQDFERTALLNPAVPQFLRLRPNADFTSETLVAYEAGYRIRPARPLYVTAAAFFHHLSDVLSTEPGAPFVESSPPPTRLVLPVIFANGLHGHTHGLEVTADVRPTTWLRWDGSWSWLRIQLTRDPDSADVSQELRGEGLSPRHQVRSHLAADLGRRWEADWLLRYVGPLASAVPGFATSDIRIGVRLTSELDLDVIGRNLHEPHHLQFPGGALGNVEIEREVLLRLTWSR